MSDIEKSLAHAAESARAPRVQRRAHGAMWLLPIALIALGALVVGPDAFAKAPPDEDYRPSSLRVFNRVVLLVKEAYVDPQRIAPKEMLLAALEAVEKEVPDVLVAPDANAVSVTAGGETKSFTTDDVTSVWELSFKLRDVFRFVETRLSPEVDKREVEYAAVNGMLGKLDPHSVLLEPKFSQEMKLNTKGEFGGLGIVISIRENTLTVISPIDGTPADKAGVKAQDKIVKIGEESTVNMGLDEAVERLRGQPGTPVVVWIMRKGFDEPQRFEIVRDIIKVDSVSHQLLSCDDKSEACAPDQKGQRVGYVKIKQFQGRTAEDTLAAVKAMEKEAGGKLNGMILDLRNNPGGLLDQAVETSNLFIGDGVLVVTQEGGSGGERREIKAAERRAIDLPLVVLMNGGSASASEIVAGAIKNRGRGVIVGDQSFGKGSVQQLYDFPDKSSLKLTIGQYLTPGDESIQSVGITPDVQTHPILAAAKESLNMFPDTHTRESDLERHLDDARTKHRESTYDVSYLADDVGQDERERRENTTKFVEDFETKLARRLVLRAQRDDREQMLTAMKPVVDEVGREEEKRIGDALSKLSVDWTRGVDVNGKLSLHVTEVAPVAAGETMKITVEAKNEGATPLHRVRAISASTLGLYSDHEFLFGYLDPGMSRSWTVEVKVPKELNARRDLIRFAAADDQTALGKLDVPVEVKSIDRPRFSYALFIDDSRNGNGDGLLQTGESVELVVSIKNTGAGNSEEPTALLKNLGGPETFIESGRQKLDPIKPNAAGLARFNFKVQPPGTLAADGETRVVAKDQVELLLRLFDGVTGDYLAEKLTFPIKAAGPADVKRKRGVVEAMAAMSVLAAADGTSPVVARAPGGTRFDAVSEVNGFVRVRLGALYGYVPASAVGPSKGKPVDANAEPKGLSWVYGRDPPRISFPDAPSGSVVVDGLDYTLKARIEDDGPVRDAIVYVGDQKVDYRRVDAKGPASVELEKKITLKPGVNSVVVIAREDDEFAQREILSIYSTKGDPLADDNARRD